MDCAMSYRSYTFYNYIFCGRITKKQTCYCDIIVLVDIFVTHFMQFPNFNNKLQTATKNNDRLVTIY